MGVEGSASLAALTVKSGRPALMWENHRFGGTVGVHSGALPRSSYSRERTMPAATARFRESTSEHIGIRTVISAALVTAFESPVPSAQRASTSRCPRQRSMN